MGTPTVYDVAAAAGVSTATVSRFFRSPERVAGTTQAAIKHAVDKLGYVPNGLARGLAERQAGALGLYSFSDHEPEEYSIFTAVDTSRVRTVSGPEGTSRLFPLFADEVLQGVEFECTERGIPLAVGWQKRDVRGVDAREILRRVDGLVALANVLPPEVAAHFARTKPIVAVGQPIGDQASPIHSVSADNRAGMLELMRHLIADHDYHRFWYVGETTGYERAARYTAFCDALHHADRPMPSFAPPATLAHGDSRQQVGELIRTVDGVGLPEVIVCANDEAAVGAIEALQEAGVDVPGQVAVTGFDGISAGRYLQPALTTVRQPMASMGRAAVQILVEKLSSTDPSAMHVTVPVELVLRSSCGCPNGEPPSRL